MLLDDETTGAVWNQGFNYPGFDDLGVGYNYYDGNSWGDYPEGSITSSWLSIHPIRIMAKMARSVFQREKMD